MVLVSPAIVWSPVLAISTSRRMSSGEMLLKTVPPASRACSRSLSLRLRSPTASMASAVSCVATNWALTAKPGAMADDICEISDTRTLPCCSLVKPSTTSVGKVSSVLMRPKNVRFCSAFCMVNLFTSLFLGKVRNATAVTCWACLAAVLA